MSRRVKQYLSGLTVIQDEEKLREMSHACEPQQGSGTTGLFIISRKIVETISIWWLRLIFSRLMSPDLTDSKLFEEMSVKPVGITTNLNVLKRPHGTDLLPLSVARYFFSFLHCTDLPSFISYDV